MHDLTQEYYLEKQNKLLGKQEEAKGSFPYLEPPNVLSQIYQILALTVEEGNQSA